jgi:hypothetical protein
MGIIAIFIYKEKIMKIQLTPLQFVDLILPNIAYNSITSSASDLNRVMDAAERSRKRYSMEGFSGGTQNPPTQKQQPQQPQPNGMGGNNVSV